MIEYNEVQIAEITKFVKNIYYANGRKLDEGYLPMWIREIINTNTDMRTLHKAEQEIIRKGITPKIFEVCEVIKNCNDVLSLPPITKCNICNSKGYVLGIKFEKNGIYAGYKAALKCICGNLNDSTMLTMIPDATNNNKTPTKDGYYRIFPSIVEETEYLDKVEANGWRDVR